MALPPRPPLFPLFLMERFLLPFLLDDLLEANLLFWFFLTVPDLLLETDLLLQTDILLEALLLATDLGLTTDLLDTDLLLETALLLQVLALLVTFLLEPPLDLLEPPRDLHLPAYAKATTTVPSKMIFLSILFLKTIEKKFMFYQEKSSQFEMDKKFSNLFRMIII